MALAVAIANKVEEWEATATWDFHVADKCGGTGYLNVGTRGVLSVLEITWVGGIRSGRDIGPKTPL